MAPGCILTLFWVGLRRPRRVAAAQRGMTDTLGSPMVPPAAARAGTSQRNVPTLKNNSEMRPWRLRWAKTTCDARSMLLHYASGSRLWWNWQTRYFEVVVG